MPRHRNLVEVPRDLAGLTHFDPRVECAPQEADLAPQAVQQIWHAVETMYRTGLHPGIQLTIRRRGKVVLNRAIGHARGNGPGADDGGEKRLLRTDTPICLFSASKAITAMLAHRMVELGRLRLDDRVADHVPEYAAHGKGRTTVRELLAHRAGIPALPVRHIDPALLTDWDEVIRLLCAARPSAGLGQQQSYHAVTAGYIVGELVQRVSGRPLAQVLREEIAEPLGCRYLRYGMAPEDRDALASNHSTGPRLGFPLNRVARRALGMDFEALAPIANTDAFLSSVVPAANIHSTADESCRFYQMLLDEGRFGNRHVFQPETVREATRAVGRIQVDRTLLVPIRFAPGFILGERPFGLYGGNCPRAFGHLGFINIVCWADPARDLSVALLNTGKSMAARSIPSLGRVLWAIGHHCSPVRSARPAP